MIVLPDADKIGELLAPYCLDNQRSAFTAWFARRVAGKTFDDATVLEAELAAALDDYAEEGLTSQTVVAIWYRVSGDEWLRALTA